MITKLSVKTLLSVVLLGLFAINARAATLALPYPPKLSVTAYALIDFTSGKVLAGQKENEPVEPASLTKMMTMYIIDQEIKAGRLTEDTKVTISKKAWRAPGSRMFAQVNSEVKASDLIRGIIIQSGNDASIAMAEYIAGSEKAFVDLMNQQAQALGMKNTQFANATGLPMKNHYTTAADMARLGRAIIHDFPDSYRLYSEKWFTYNGIKQPNRNRLLWRDPHVDGIKTGHTDSAGFCLVASGKNDNMRLVAVTIGAKSDNERAEETQRLLNYGFRFFESHTLYQQEQVLSTPRLWSGSKDKLNLGVAKPVTIVIPKGQYNQLKANLTLAKHIEAPVEKGQNFGTLNITLNDETLYQAPLIALESVAKGGLWRRLKDVIALSSTRIFS